MEVLSWRARGKGEQRRSRFPILFLQSAGAAVRIFQHLRKIVAARAMRPWPTERFAEPPKGLFPQWFSLVLGSPFAVPCPGLPGQAWHIAFRQGFSTVSARPHCSAPVREFRLQFAAHCFAYPSPFDVISSCFCYFCRFFRLLKCREQDPTGCSQVAPKCGLQLSSPAVHHPPETSVENAQVGVVTDCVGKRYQVLLAAFS